VIRWSLERARDAVGGESLGDPAEFTGVSIDTRTLEPGALYVAIAGENHDGHGFVADAFERGAAAAIVSDPKAVPAGMPAVVAPDTRRALGALAAAYRGTLSARVVAVTGSAGKTSTVRLLDAALGVGLTGSASPRSYNNDIGVPLTILAASETDDYLVCEIGTSAPGEIAPLASIARPDIAMITSVGRAHLEKLGDLAGVRLEKSAIFSALAPDALALIPSVDPDLRELTPPHARTVGTCEHAHLRVENVRPRADDVSFTLDGHAYECPLPGAHHAVNAAFAVAAARALGLDPETVARGLADAEAPEMRGGVSRLDTVTLVNDAYNANPESTAASLLAFAAAHAEAERRVVVLGDMLELGPHAGAAHDEIAAMVRGLGFDVVVAVGPEMSRSLEGLADLAFESVSGVEARIAHQVAGGDAVLLKGSRGMALERVEAALRERAGAGAA